MLRRRLAAIGWGSRESLPSLSSWARALAHGVVAFGLGVLVLAVVPNGVFGVEGGLPHPTGDTVVEYFLTDPLHLLVFLLPAALVIAIFRLDRGREDRHDPLALLAVALLALGFATTLACAGPIIEHGGEWRPFGLVALSVSSFVGSAVLSLASLAILTITRSPRRGRAYAAFTLVCSSWFGWALYAFVLFPRGAPPELRDGIELPLVTEGTLGSYMDAALPYEDWPRETLRVHADGDLEWEGERIGSVTSADGGSQLRRVLLSISDRMPQEQGLPDGSLFLRADRRAPAAVVSRILTECRDDGIGLWKIAIEVSLDRVQEGLPNWGRIFSYLPSNRPGRGPEGVAADDFCVVEVHAAPDEEGGLRSLTRYRGRNLDEPEELVEAILGDWRRWRPEGAPSPCGVLLRVDPRLSWGAVARVCSDLLNLAGSRGDRELHLSGLETLGQ